MTTVDPRSPLGITRRARILDALRSHGTLRVSELSGLLGVAPVTVRRDVARLAGEGLIRRVHGGATLVAPGLAAGDLAARGLAAGDLAAPGLAAGGTAAAGLVAGEDAALQGVHEDVGPAAAAARRAQPRSIGMLVPSLDYYWPGVVRGAEEEARARRLRIVLRGSSYDADDTWAQLARLIEQAEVSGVVLAPNMNAPHTAEALERLAATGIPVVLIERTASVGSHSAVVESVVTDHALGAAMAVRHLVSLGHRKVGLVVSRPSPTGPHVHRGWLQAAEECGFALDETVDVTVPGPRSPDWVGAVDHVLDRCRRTGTTALLVHADAEAIGLVQRCEARGLTVPADLSVVSYDDEVASLFSPPLTAVRPHRRSLGGAAVELVAARLADPGRPTHRVIICPSLRIRESSAPPPGTFGGPLGD